MAAANLLAGVRGRAPPDAREPRGVRAGRLSPSADGAQLHLAPSDWYGLAPWGHRSWEPATREG